MFFTKQEDTLAEADTNMSINTNIPHSQGDAETLGSRKARGAIIQRASLSERLGGAGRWLTRWCLLCSQGRSHTNFYHHRQILVSKAYPSGFSYSPRSSPTCSHRCWMILTLEIVIYSLINWWQGNLCRFVLPPQWSRGLVPSKLSFIEKIIWWDFAYSFLLWVLLDFLET